MHASEFEEFDASLAKTQDGIQDENEQPSYERDEADISERSGYIVFQNQTYNDEEWRKLREIGNIMLALTESSDVSFMPPKRFNTAKASRS